MGPSRQPAAFPSRPCQVRQVRVTLFSGQARPMNDTESGRTLPRVAWTGREDLAALVAALGAEQVRWVGGAVRDTLLGNEVKDIDAATPLEPGAVIDLL